jgi:hypothetical protein
MAVESSNYPTSLDTPVELVEAANNAADQLSGNIDASVTTIPVMDATEFAASGIVAIDAELFGRCAVLNSRIHDYLRNGNRDCGSDTGL